jgi:galactokinase
MAATRYGNELSRKSTERVQEGLALPVFDSLPATAGLSNLEAFQLSLKHVLALLPRMLPMRDAAVQAESAERFTLR